MKISSRNLLLDCLREALQNLELMEYRYGGDTLMLQPELNKARSQLIAARSLVSRMKK